MKKNFFYSVMAVFTLLFMAACSQEEIISSNETNGGKVVLSVNVSGATPDTRAVADVQGYVMRCIMEAVDSEGTVIEGTRMVQPVTAGKAIFEFEKNASAANYLFWADYVEGTDINDAKKVVYNAETLTNITYRLNKTNGLFNNPAADAFCAAVATGDLSGSVTLKRPFTRIAVKTADVDALGLTGLTHINPNLYAGAGFNVATGKATTKGQLQATVDSYVPVLTDGEFAFYCYVLATVAEETRTSAITFSNEDGSATKSIQLTADQMMSLQSNTSVSLKPGDDKIKVEIVIDDAFEGEETDPEEPQPAGELKVGAYINAQGEVVAEATDAVAVVFSMAISGTDDTSASYGESYAPKTIKAYAVALGNATPRTNLTASDAEAFPTLTASATTFQGFTATDYLLNSATGVCKDFTGGVYTKYNEWLASNPVAGANISSWYIPTYKQLEVLTGKIFGEEADAELAKIVTPQSFLTNPGSDAAVASNGWYLLSGTINSGLKFSVFTIGNGNDAKAEASAYTCQAGQADAAYSTRGFIRPMLTIFE